MTKNYTLIHPKSSIVKSVFTLNTVLAFLFVLFGMSSSFGQVGITKPSLTINTCVFPSAYSVLPQIQIQENQNDNTANEGTGRTIILTAPANFEFNPGFGIIVDRSRDVNNSTITVTSTTITITYDCSATTQTDRWRINNIEIRAINIASTGDITRTGGTGTVNGLINGTTLTNTLTSTFTPAVANGGGAATVCVGATTPAFTNATGGGVWSVTNGTGSATISLGGVLTGVTSGTVTAVYTVGGCSSNSAVTVNAAPTITTQPVVTSICTTGTGTFSVVATGATTYQWRRNGVALTNVAPYSGVNTATLTITNPALAAAGNFDVIVGNGTCSVTSTARALTVTTVPSTVATPTPANAATGICYAGGGAVSSISWGAAATATSYDVYFGAGSVPGAVTANVLTNTYNTGALAANTTYFWRIVAKNACGNAVTSATFSFTTAAAPCALIYCNPTYASGPGTTDGITNVTLLTLNNPSGANNVSPYYTFYNAVTIPNLLQSSTPALSISYGTDANQWGAVWIDFNQNGIFEATEGFVSTVNAGASGTSVITITVPPGAVLGNTRMRVRGGNDSILTTSQACGVSSSGFGETEDYIVNIIAPVACVTPTAQPTALALTPAGTTINGTFTAASPAPNSYLVVANTTGVAPTIVNGTTYTIGSGALGGTNVVIDTDGNTSFSASSLAPLTTYYFFVYSFNNLCTGGPLYNTTSPLTGNATTSVSYCLPTGTLGVYPITNVTFTGAGINNSDTGAGLYYQDFTAITGNVTGGSTYNISVTATATGNPVNVFYQYVFFDWNNNGVFTDAGETYLIGTYSTPTGTLNINIQIPVTAYVGTIRMRVGNSFNRILSPCTTEGYFQMEDYSLNITAAPPCTTPTTQPTVLVLTPGATSIAGSFTAAGAPTPQNYLVVMNTTGTAPTGLIANGTTYTIGSSIGVGNTVIDTDSNTTFTAAGLNTTSTYYFYIYSMNALCTGGPLYNTNPTVLIGNATTVGSPAGPCIPTTAAPRNTDRYISRVAFIGTMVETNNISTFNNATPGYQDFTGLPLKAVQAQGEGVNMIVESIGGRTKLIAWVDWNKNGTFESSEIVYNPGTAGISSTFGFIIPTGAVPGDYKVRVRTFNSFYNDGNAANGNPDEYFGLDYDACQPFSTSTYLGYPTTQYGEAEDYLFTVIQRCDANIVSVTDGQVCNSGTVSLSATGTAGTTEYRWYAVASGGSQLAGSPTTGNWTTPSISTTTTYYVTAWNGTCESLERKPVVANVNAVPTLTFTPSAPETCGENNIISITATGDKELSNLLFENFEGGGLGLFTNVNSDPSPAAIKSDTRWTNRASTFVPLAGISWKPAISSGLAPNNFALATSDSGTPPDVLVENSLESGVLNSTNYLNLTMTMKFYYSRYFPDGTTPADEFVSIQISQNGGGAWTTLQTFTADTGIGTKFANLSYNLNAYINQTNLKVRILHHSLGSVIGWLPDGVAVDDVKIFGEVPLGTSFNWVSVLPVDAYSDAACTTPYVSGSPAVMVYIKPTLAQLEQTSYSFTASALLSNGCSASSLVTINNKSKVWKGGSSNDWNNPNNWSPVGVPDATTCVIIPTAPNNSLIGGTNVNGFGKTLQVIGNGNLTIDPTNTLTITDFVEVRDVTSVFNIENSGSLIQVNNVANTGTINMRRNAITNSPLDYVYWSTPVAGFSVNAITPASTYRYQWNPTTVTGLASNFGNWLPASGGMTTGRGYIIRGSSGASTFTGVPNNGNINTNITRSTYIGGNYVGPTSTMVTQDDDNWNLLGNPYPSAISADAFLAANSSNLNQFVKIWAHGIDPTAAIADPFYQDYVLNYSTGDYLTYNALGGTQAGFDGLIGAGQGFFVLMNNAASTSENAVFNNTMRNNAYRNDQFYRNGDGIERNRIWLDIISPSNASITTLVGYTVEASDNLDTKFDAIAQGVKTNFELYSIAESQELIIQGRSLPFNQNDKVALGYSIPANGIYTIAINSVDGLFADANQDIYLEDTTLGVIHDLRTAPYTFTGTLGNNETRFILRYTNETLGSEDFSAAVVSVYANENINVNASNQTITSVRVFDLLGRVIGTYNSVNATTFSTKNLAKTQSALLVEVTLESGATKTYKVIF